VQGNLRDSLEASLTATRRSGHSSPARYYVNVLSIDHGQCTAGASGLAGRKSQSSIESIHRRQRKPAASG
jgi:hypothetical protein